MSTKKHPFGDPYYLFNMGKNDQAYRLLGSHVNEEGGVTFRVWAPNAQAVEIIGDFNEWVEGRDPMTMHEDSGIWECTIGHARHGERYKYIVTDQQGKSRHKSDPFARYAELRPNIASIIQEESDFAWTDGQYMFDRPDARANNYPLNIYEVHAGSWRRHPDDSFYNYRELAHALADYVTDMGYNYVELLPIMEHPLDASWGYQVTGFFATTSRFGSPDDFRYFVNYMHERGIGVILDWVPAHYPKDAFGLYHFDGTPTYESSEPRLAEQKEWGTMLFDTGKNEVRSFLFSSAVFWLQEFHVDGLRVDAVSTILYRNYGSAEYLPNRFGGRESLEGIAFLKELNTLLRQRFPKALLIAEEATTWPRMTHEIEHEGLGFTFKWDMGWMHDTLDYMSLDYLYRYYHHNQITFSMSYGFSERFLLPLSHDEVVHGKLSLIDRMPGDYWRKFACLRTLFGYMIAHPGGKLLFMGGEFAQFIEWRFYEELQWFMLGFDAHRQMQDFVREINHLYLDHPAFWQIDTNWEGFRWINADDARNSIYSFYRKDEKGNVVVCIMNETPAPVPDYSVGMPAAGVYTVMLNSDETRWGGSGYPLRQKLIHRLKNREDAYREGGKFYTNHREQDGLRDSLTLDLPPLSVIYLYHKVR